MARTRTSPPPADEVPLRLHEWFELFDLKDDEVAERLGVTTPTVNRWINGRRQVKPREQARIAAMLGITPDALWRTPTADDIAKIVSGVVSNQDEAQKLPAEIIQRVLKRPKS